jgi:hypothetical protein
VAWLYDFAQLHQFIEIFGNDLSAIVRTDGVKTDDSPFNRTLKVKRDKFSPSVAANDEYILLSVRATRPVV